MSRYGPTESDPAELRPGDPPTLAGNYDGRMIGGRRQYTSEQVAESLGISMHSGRRLWRALGFPSVPPGVPAFTDRDIEAGRRLVELVRAGVLTNYAGLELTRAMGRGMDRLSSWQVEVLAGQVRAHRRANHSDQDLEPAVALAEQAAEVAELVSFLVEDLEGMATHVWRRHLSAALASYLHDLQLPDDDANRRSVGFVDLVGFTEMVRAMPGTDVEELVAQFEGIAADVVAARGGRLVKTIGDEVMFLTRSPGVAIQIGMDLVAEAEAGFLPTLRVGVCVGEVVLRMGDVYGNTVNLAARLTDVGAANSVLVDAETAGRLDTAAATLTEQPSAALKGFGVVRVFAVTRP